MTVADIIGAAKDADTKLIERLRARVVRLEHQLERVTAERDALRDAAELIEQWRRAEQSDASRIRKERDDLISNLSESS